MNQPWKFRFLAIVALVCSFGLLTGCDSNEDDGDFDDLQGLWTLVEADVDGEVTEYDDQIFIRFEDNQATIYAFVPAEPELETEDCYFIFTEEVERDGDGFTVPDPEGDEEDVDISFSGNTMTWTSSDGETTDTFVWQRSSVSVNTLEPECDFGVEL